MSFDEREERVMHIPQPGVLWLALEVLAALFAILYPLVLVLVLRRRLGVGWRYVAFGALIFLLFQLISRVPLVGVANQLLAPWLQASLVALVGWYGVLAITAGLFEEVGRYVGYRWLMRREEKTWEKAVMYGVGHGGLESAVLVGLGIIGTLASLLVLASVNLATLPAAQQEAVSRQYAALAAQPGWFPLLALWERLWTLPVHIALSVVVVQVFLRGQQRWLWIAVLAHALLDFVVLVVQLPLSGHPVAAGLLAEGVVAIFGVLALWTIRALRPVPSALPMLTPERLEQAEPHA